MYPCGCHGNLVTIATRHVADALSSERTSIPSMDSIRLKTKELQSKMYLIQTHRLIGLTKTVNSGLGRSCSWQYCMSGIQHMIAMNTGIQMSNVAYDQLECHYKGIPPNNVMMLKIKASTEEDIFIHHSLRNLSVVVTHK